MKIALMNGGLGNQLFQYIFIRFVELASGETCFVDDSSFFIGNEHNGYEIEKIFPVEPKLLSRTFEKDVWEYILGRIRAGNCSVCQCLKDSGTDIFMVAETADYCFDGNMIRTPANSFIPSIAITQGDVYYHGYWINKHWFASHQEIFLKEFQFPPITDKQNSEYLYTIQTEPCVGIHIRRGDFVDIGWALPKNYYVSAIRAMEKRLPDARYFVFSDDIEHCRSHYKEYGFDNVEGRVEFVEGNMNGKNYIDMQLMSMCRGLIVSTSSFSYFAALINTVPDKVIVNLSGREI